MTSDLDLGGAWEVLGTGREAAGIAVVRTGVAVRAGDVLVGVDGFNRRHLLIPLLPGEAAKTSANGRAVHIMRLAHEGQPYLTVCCLLPELQGVFTQFCHELLNSVRKAESPAREVMEAYVRWRSLFSDASQERGLTDEAVVGLFGELLVLEKCLASGAPGHLEYWVGPFAAVHDFRVQGHALEVKATLTREGRIVPIASVDQLEPPSEASLHLVHVRLELDPSALDLEALVARLVAAGAARLEIGRRIAALGGSVDRLDTYAARKLRLVELRVYDVEGMAFPRITREAFKGGELPPGTLNVSYSIDLTNEPPWPLDASGVERVFDDFAEKATHGLDS